MKTTQRLLASGLLALSLAAATIAAADEAPSRTGVDAPELAALGQYAVGVRSVTLVHRDQVDLSTIDPQTGIPAMRDRSLKVEIWYPAKAAAGAAPVIYEDAMESEPPAPPAKFRIQGLALRDAKPDGGHYPLVIVAHGYGNVPIAMSWLTENLASKGYVVAAIRHEDMYLNPAGFAQATLRRPLDIAFVARELQSSLGKSGEVDPARTALIGYSMGGYGVLAAGGATLDPAGGLVTRVPGGLLAPYARGGALSAALVVPAVKAIVAFAPAGGAFGAFGAAGIAGIKSPLLLISGDHDLTVDYTSGARAYFDQAINSNRYLLTFLGGGHAVGLGPAPPEMRTDLWNQDWFEDSVWRKDRLISISLHFVTAFLDRYVKDDASRSAYIDGLVVESSAGRWDAPQGTPWSARSPGGDVTLWKGFQRRHATGLSLVHAEANSTPQ
ncbi:MAG: alpha/beta hydrolase [Gammaproteobacteria bacterium]|nr:alpha/beta hydrolase [Gammaproteobacteria bacterium]